MRPGYYKIELTALMTLTASEHRVEVFKKEPTSPVTGSGMFKPCTKDNVILALHSSAATVISYMYDSYLHQINYPFLKRPLRPPGPQMLRVSSSLVSGTVFS